MRDYTFEINESSIYHLMYVFIKTHDGITGVTYFLTIAISLQYGGRMKKISNCSLGNN